jgi:DNA (cytosine-5)-methyltransferase 1
MALAYYNEIDPFAAAWLRELIKAGHIAPGDVDERSIEDVRPADLAGYTQCHFFAGIGGWSLALRLAGWPDDRPVWTGSCPCQPFSAAGKRKGTADERHLWPGWFHLISVCRPVVIFGEQVEAAVNHGWLDLVQADLEGEGYAVGAVGVPAAGVGAPHGRARLWFVADAESRRTAAIQQSGQLRGIVLEGKASGQLGDSSSPRCEGDGLQQVYGGWERQGQDACVAGSGTVDESDGIMAHPQHDGHGRAGADATVTGSDGQDGGVSERGSGGLCESFDVGDPDLPRSQGLLVSGDSTNQRAAGEAGLVNGFWRDAQWLWCRDEKYRPVEPGTFPLAHGVPNRVGRLRGYGNAIVPQVAAEVVRAYMEGGR